MCCQRDLIVAQRLFFAALELACVTCKERIEIRTGFQLSIGRMIGILEVRPIRHWQEVRAKQVFQGRISAGITRSMSRGERT